MDFQKIWDFYAGKRVLVTGHTGFKGSWLVKILQLAGAKVTGYALEPPTDPALFDMAHLADGMTHVVGDVRDLPHLRAVFSEAQPEVVFHLAAQPIVRASYREPAYTYDVNVMGTVNVCECVRLTPSVKSFVNVTTDKVYRNPETGHAFTEDEFLDGYDPYSNSKSCSELVTASYTRSFLKPAGVAVSTVRAGNVIGGGDYAEDRLIPDAVRAVLAGQPVFLRNPASVRPFQHVLEPLFVYLMVAARQWEDHTLAGHYNVGPDEEDCVTAETLAEAFAAAWGDDVRVECADHAEGPHEAGLLRLDCTKLKKTFGWEPRWHADKAAALTADFAKAVRAGEDAAAVMERQIREYMTMSS